MEGQRSKPKTPMWDGGSGPIIHNLKGKRKDGGDMRCLAGGQMRLRARAEEWFRTHAVRSRLLRVDRAGWLCATLLLLGCDQDIQQYVMYPPFTVHPDSVTMRMDDYFAFAGIEVHALDSSEVHEVGIELDPSKVGYDIRKCANDCSFFLDKGWVLVDEELAIHTPKPTCRGPNCVTLTSIQFHIHENLESTPIPLVTGGETPGFKPKRCGETYWGASLKESSGGIVWPKHDVFSDTTWINVVC